MSSGTSFASAAIDDRPSVRSPLRWAGSKRLLLPAILPSVRPVTGTYFEPFAGAANLFFALRPPTAVLSDLNPELIDFYRALRDSADELLRRLSSLTASESQYYAIRSRAPRSPVARAVRFLYLNRLCWNGLYRVNRQGRFNVPIGDRLPKRLWQADALRRAAGVLQGTQFRIADFQEVLVEVRPGDTVFLDPPYPRGAHRDLEAFNRYGPEAWSGDDYLRLAAEAIRLDRLGAVVVVTIASRRDLITLFPRSFHRVVHRTRALISCNGAKRRSVLEAILTNSPPEGRLE